MRHLTITLVCLLKTFIVCMRERIIETSRSWNVSFLLLTVFFVIRHLAPSIIIIIRTCFHLMVLYRRRFTVLAFAFGLCGKSFASAQPPNHGQIKTDLQRNYNYFFVATKQNDVAFSILARI